MTFRHARRSLTRAPGFTVLAVTILAIGIGATTVMFTLVQAVILRELPFEDPDRLVWLYNLRTERDRAPLSAPDLDDYRRQASTLAGVAAFTNWTTNLTGVGTPERLDGVRVSGAFFGVLGTRAWLGRVLQPDDETRAARVTVLTYGLWLRRFGGNPAVVGQEIALNGATYTIAGVLPPRFLFPFREAELAVPLPLASDPRRADRGANFLRVIARLAPSVALDEATADLNAIARRLQTLYPTENARKTGISVYPLHAEIVRDYQGMLWTLFASVGALLLAGCVNIANLLLVRAAARHEELTIRLSLGASRGRVARELLAESALLGIAGGACGIACAVLGLTVWRTWGPSDFPQMSDVTIDWRVLLFAIAVSSLTALACGIVPAYLAARDSAAALRGATRAMTSSRARRAVQRAFVIVQVGVAAVLLVGVLLMSQGLARLEDVSPGFTPDRALSLQLSLPPAMYASPDALTRFYEALRDRVGAIRGVESAGVVSLLPLSGLLSTADIAFPDRPAPPPNEVPQAHLRVASAQYFEAAGIKVLEGRPFDDRDRKDSQPVAIVSRTFAARHWPGERVVGKGVQLVQATAAPRLEVIGVVSDVKQFTLDAPATADLYVPLHQMPAFQAPLIAARMYWVVRGPAGIAEIGRAMQAAVAQVDPGVATSSVRTLESLWRASLGSRRANVRLLQVFGNLSLILCAIGVYGVAAFAASTRRRELAIRSALGASRRALTLSMLRGELLPVGVGLIAGLAVALLVAPLVFGAAFNTDPRATLTYGQVAAILFSVAAVAIYLPIRRACATNPSDALQP
jgi:putative ABC transport system permease protein